MVSKRKHKGNTKITKRVIYHFIDGVYPLPVPLRHCTLYFLLGVCYEVVLLVLYLHGDFWVVFAHSEHMVDRVYFPYSRYPNTSLTLWPRYTTLCCSQKSSATPTHRFPDSWYFTHLFSTVTMLRGYWPDDFTWVSKLALRYLPLGNSTSKKRLRVFGTHLNSVFVVLDWSVREPSSLLLFRL